MRIEGGLSRRGLFGAGLSRALGASPADAGEAPARPRVEPPPATAGEADATRLGPRLGPVARRALDYAGLTGPTHGTAAVVAAGDGTPLAAMAAALAHVIAVEPDSDLRGRGAAALPGVEWRAGDPRRLPLADGEADAVLAWFGATYAPDPRAVAAELLRVAAPGAPVVLAAWAPAARHEIGGPGASGSHRPEQWSRYETAYRHFYGRDGFDVLDGSIDGLDYALVVVRA